MVNRLNIRDARPGDAPFLAKCILSSMHLYDFETYPSDDMAGILSRLEPSCPIPGRSTLSAGRGPSGSSGRSISQSTPMTTPRRTPESGTWIPSQSFPSTGGWGSVRPSSRTASGKGSRRGSTGWHWWRTRSTPILSGSTSRWGSPRMGQGTPSGRIS